MASSSGTSSNSSNQLTNLMDLKKRKRMLSNRESARRSRLRKQRHVDELMALASQLKKENGEIMMTLNLQKSNFVAVEAENTVLRTQAMELTFRLNSLNEMLLLISDHVANPWGFSPMNQIPVLQYY